jgi:invasion protein IalB
MKNESSPLNRPPSIRPLVFASGMFLLVLWATAFAQQPSDTATPEQKAPESEIAPRGQRPAIRAIEYGDWRKLCFKSPGTNMVCRTTISGKWETGQSAVRADLIEREGEGNARLQLFLPVGLYLPAGVKISIDQGPPYRIPYVWCLTNSCIAADVADPKLIQSMEAGQTLSLEVVDSNVLTVSTILPLGRFAAARNGSPEQTFAQEIDE